MKEYIKLFSMKSILLCLCIYISIILIGCKDYDLEENNLVGLAEIGHEEEVVVETVDMEASSIENVEEETSMEDMLISETNMETTISCYEGEWNRTGVASYEWARITISNWIEGESFDVVLLANYADYGGPIEGTAIFISENTAVVYDENLMNAFQGQVDDYGVYFQFKEDSIVVTHSEEVKPCFGGAGIVTAEGTYIQGKPNYTNVTDVSTIFTEDELKEIQKLLGDKYETMFEWVIEMGETEEYSLTEGTLWKAYYPPYGAVWCNILIYNDGSIYIEGSYWEKGYWFYSNTDATEMPDIEN